MEMGNNQKSRKWRKANQMCFPGHGGREEKTTRDSLGQGSDQEAQASGGGVTTGKVAFSIPICWVKKVRLRSLEYKFKSLLEIMSWLKSWLLQGTGISAGCSIG